MKGKEVLLQENLSQLLKNQPKFALNAGRMFQ